MPRRPLHVLTLASAVICVGSLILVGRTFFRADRVIIKTGQGVSWAEALDGQLLLEDYRYNYPTPPLAFTAYDATSRRRMLRARWVGGEIKGVRWIGFGFDVTSNPAMKVLVLPLWPVPILTAILPIKWWRQRRFRSELGGFAVVESPAEQT
jgi:hypothetical protein